MKFLFIPLSIIVITALGFGYFGYQAKNMVNVPLIIASVTAFSVFLAQLIYRKVN